MLEIENPPHTQVYVLKRILEYHTHRSWNNVITSRFWEISNSKYLSPSLYYLVVVGFLYREWWITLTFSHKSQFSTSFHVHLWQSDHEKRFSTFRLIYTFNFHVFCSRYSIYLPICKWLWASLFFEPYPCQTLGQSTDVTSKNCFDHERLMWIRFARHIPFRRAHSLI